MLIEMDLRSRSVPYGWNDPRQALTGGDYKIRCVYVPIRCGEETVAATVLRAPVDVGGLVLPAGTLVLSSDTRDGPVTFCVAPVKKADFAALVERQIAEREAGRAEVAAADWTTSG